MQRIYLDNNAATPLDQRILRVMLEELKEEPANPSSNHFFGQRAKNRLFQARAKVASFFQVQPEEILFTSGATESLNLLLRGFIDEGHVISTKIEHAAIYETIKDLSCSKIEVSYVKVDEWGAPKPDAIFEAMRPDTRAIVLSMANGETGVKLDVASIAKFAKRKGVPLFLDGVAYVGKEPLQIFPGIKALAISAHKFHGPTGVGALYLHKSIKLKHQITGGAQENMLRAGTENLAGILGLAKALEILQSEQTMITKHLKNLQNRLETALLAEIPDLQINGKGPRVCNTTNIAIDGIDGESFLMQLDLAGLAVSYGSACSAGLLEPSRVLLNMGFNQKKARSSIRLSLSRMNREKEIDQSVEILVQTIKKLRQIACVSSR